MDIDRSMFEKLDNSSKDYEHISLESKSFLRSSWDRLKKNKMALAGLIVLGIVILMAIFGPIISPYTYDGQDAASRNLLPSFEHPFGTDKFGRDIFVRVQYGARISLLIGFSAAGVCLVIGVIYGGISGFVGGLLDIIMMRIVEILVCIPNLLIIILVMLKFGSSVFSVLLGICLTSWTNMARIVRTQVLTLKEQEFALAVKVMGAGKARILFKHLIVNCVGPIIVSVMLIVPSAIFSEAFLSFVGIGIAAPMASWGTLANEARSLLELYPIQAIWPVAAICITMLSLNFIGDGLSDALDPKKK